MCFPGEAMLAFNNIICTKCIKSSYEHTMGIFYECEDAHLSRLTGPFVPRCSAMR